MASRLFNFPEFPTLNQVVPPGTGDPKIHVKTLMNIVHLSPKKIRMTFGLIIT